MYSPLLPCIRKELPVAGPVGDTNHVLNSDYSEIIIVGAGADAVDFKLVSLLQRGDICVSQDYGVAAMALGKGCYAIHLRSNSPLDCLPAC